MRTTTEKRYDEDTTRRSGPTGATTPFKPSLVDHGRWKDMGRAWRANRDPRREA